MLAINKAFDTLDSSEQNSKTPVRPSSNNRSIQSPSDRTSTNDDAFLPSPQVIKANLRKKEASSLPRLIYITGVGGNHQATLQSSDGTTSQVTINSHTANGMLVVNITPHSVELVSTSSGEKYTITPKGAPTANTTYSNPAIALEASDMYVGGMHVGPKPTKPKDAVSLDGLPFTVF